MERVPRVTDSEAKEIVGKITSIKDLLRHANSLPKYVAPEDVDTTKGFLYLSRFNKDINNVIKESDQIDNHESDVDDKSHCIETAETDVIAEPTMNGEKKRRFAMSLASLASKAHKRLSIVKDGAIQALIGLSQIGDDVIQMSCSVAFAQLSKEKAARAKMIEDGAISSILSLSNSSILDVKANCCRALCNLTCEPGSEYRAVKDGAAFTVTNIASVCPNVKDDCIKVLLNLSCVMDKYSRLEDVNEALMDFNASQLTLQQDIILLSTLVNLSAIRNNQLRLVEDGCLRIVERVISSPSNELRKLSSDVVRNLTTCHKTRSKLLEQNIISTLLLMAKDDMEEVRTLAIKALYNLSRDISCRVKIVTGNAVSVILKICMEKITNVEMGRTAAKILRILCGDSNTAHKLVSDGIVRALMSLLRTDDGVIQQYCAESICALFQMGDVLDRLVEQGAVDVIVSLSHHNTDKITGEWCAFALYHLSTNRVCTTVMLEQGILPCLIKLCVDSTTRTRCFCSAALVYITLNKMVDSSCAIPVLVDMLRNEADQTTKTNCATALYNLADNDENCHVMLDVGALMPIVMLTTQDFVQTKMKCAAILSRLSLHRQYHHLFASDDVLRLLLGLSSVEHLLTQRRVVIALSNLSQLASLRQELRELDPVKYIISLASKRDENLWRGCMAIVCNLSFDAGSEEFLVKGGILPTLLITALINTDELLTKVICVKAMLNLMADESLYPVMVREGIIWALSSLGQLDNLELLTLSADALCRLSCDFAKEMIESSAAIKTVIKLINQSDVELQRVGARTLTNMLLRSTDSDDAFRRQVAEEMSGLARSKDEEVVEMCILCLCLASQSESCRATIVSTGLLKYLDASNTFTLPHVSYAYLTMFGNIANNPKMRTELLDDQSVSRFQRICVSEDPNLDLAVAKALYYITCAPENIVKLTQQNTLALLETIWKAKYTKSAEMIHHMIAILYNMCIHEEVQNQLVSQGAVKMFVELWPRAREDIKLCRLVCSGVCHLACGNVNTTRMVEDGCTPILTFLSCYSKQSYPNYYFDTSMYERCAASMRNLLNVVINQGIMVEGGCLQALVEMFNLAVKFQSTQGISIRKNIASALRSLTFNPRMREMVITSGAIKVILAELTEEMAGDDSLLTQNLMKELEAESWNNGSRGNQREGRAPYIASASMYTELLRSTMNVQLDVEIRRAVLQKYHVQIQLDEPKIDIQESTSPILGLSIADLASYEESDDCNYPTIQACPREECVISDDVISFCLTYQPLRSDSLKSDDKDLHGEPDEDSGNIGLNLPDLKKNQKRRPTTHHHGMHNHMSLTSDLPKLSTSGKSDLSMPPRAQSSSALTRLRADPEKKFKGLVQLIKHSKQKKGASIEDVIKEWNALSKR